MNIELAAPISCFFQAHNSEETDTFLDLIYGRHRRCRREPRVSQRRKQDTD
jgi:hypothetical protein